MKSEHRHDLQTNDLGKMTQKAWAATEEHGLKIAIVVCLLTVVIAGVRIYRHNSSTTQAGAWGAFTAANSPDDYAVLANNKDWQGTNAANWARLVGAEARLSQAIQLMFTDRANAVSDLEDARGDFEKLIDNSQPTIRERAIFGLARAQESLGNTQKATSEYAKLAGDAFAKSVYHEEAKQRAEYLAQSDPQAFYTWFKKQNPKLPEAPKPEDTGLFPESGLEMPLDLPFGAGTPFGSPTEKESDDADTDADTEADKKLPTLDDKPADESKSDAPPADGDAPAEPTEGDTPAEPAEGDAPAESGDEKDEKDAGGADDSSDRDATDEAAEKSGDSE